MDNPVHRRFRLVRLTDDGRALIAGIAPREHDQLRAVAEHVTDADVAGPAR